MHIRGIIVNYLEKRLHDYIVCLYIQFESFRLIFSYIDSRDASSTGPSAGKHGPFYSVCQVSVFSFEPSKRYISIRTSVILKTGNYLNSVI